MKRILTQLGSAAFLAKRPGLFCLLRMLRFRGTDSPYIAINCEFTGRLSATACIAERRAVDIFDGATEVESAQEFVYVGPKAYQNLDELYKLHSGRVFVFPKLVSCPPAGAIFILNDEEKSSEDSALDRVFSNVIPGARPIENVPWFVTGWPLGLLRMTYNVYRVYGKAKIHVVGVDFYTSKVKHADNYLQRSSVRKPIKFKSAMLKHDVILNFWVTRCLWRRGLLAGDEGFERVMRMDVSSFAKTFFSNL